MRWQDLLNVSAQVCSRLQAVQLYLIFVENPSHPDLKPAGGCNKWWQIWLSSHPPAAVRGLMKVFTNLAQLIGSIEPGYSSARSKPTNCRCCTNFTAIWFPCSARLNFPRHIIRSSYISAFVFCPALSAPVTEGPSVLNDGILRYETNVHRTLDSALLAQDSAHG